MVTAKALVLAIWPDALSMRPCGGLERWEVWERLDTHDERHPRVLGTGHSAWRAWEDALARAEREQPAALNEELARLSQPG